MAEQKTKSLHLREEGGDDSMGPSGANHLLVIAIDEYEHCPPLSNCKSDALKFIEVLKEKYDFEDGNIQTLYNKEATRANIHAKFKDLKNRIKPQDSLLIYFSGHGETEDNVGYWVPVEAQPNHEWEFVSTNDIKARLDAINSFHTFVIVDACFSGALFSSYRSIKPGVDTRRSRLGLAASHTRERALDGAPGNNSPFAENLLKRLRGNTGELSAHQLAAGLIEDVLSATEGKQTPVFKPLNVKGDDSGQYVFRLRADEPTEWAATQQIGTLAAYQAFLKKFPEGEHAEEAKAKAIVLQDEEAWQAAKSANTVKAYFNYRQSNPDGQYREQALEAIQEMEEEQIWNRAKRARTIYEYEHYLEKYPQGKYAAEAQAGLEALIGGMSPAKTPPAKPAPVKETPAKELPQAKQEPPKPAKEEKPAATQPEKVVAKPQSAQAAPATTTGGFNRNYLFAGGGALVVLVVIAIFVFSRGDKGNPTEAVTMELFETGGKYGYKDETGKELLAARYDQAEPFKNGTARVTVDGKTFTIDATGTCIADCPDAKTTDQEAATKQENLAAKPEQPSNNTGGKSTAEETTAPKETAPKTGAAATVSSSGVTFGGKTYSLVQLKGLTWMSQNLDYDVPDSWCYGGSSGNCSKYGRLYTWEAAKKACAAMGSGWRLPTDQEWRAMAQQFGGADEDADDGGEAAYKALISGGSSRFSAQFGGWRADGSFKHLDQNGYYWSSTENDFGLVALFYFSKETNSMNRLNNDPRLAFSCRCVKK